MYRSRELAALLAGVLLISAASSAAWAVQLADSTAASREDTAIRDVVKAYLEARERKDEKSLAAVFTGDVDQLVSSGEWRRGQANLVTGTLASSARETGRRVVEIETIRYITKDVAIADGRYTIAGGAAGDGRRMWSTFVMKREKPGIWKISAIRNMFPAQPQSR